MIMVSIREAADRLGVSQDTIRRRLRAGTLRGEQEETPQGFRWRVEVATSDQEATTNRQEHPQASDTLVAVLQNQIEAQAEELDARRREIQELHVLLQTAQTALTAPKEGIRTAWWRFWK